MYIVIGSCSAPAISSRRPIITAGPIDRNSKPRSSGSEEGFGGGTGGSTGPRPCAQSGPETDRQRDANNTSVQLRLVDLASIGGTSYHTRPPLCPTCYCFSRLFVDASDV